MGARWNRLGEVVQACTRCVMGRNVKNIISKFSLCTAEKNLCILQGQVFLLCVRMYIDKSMSKLLGMTQTGMLNS